MKVDYKKIKCSAIRKGDKVITGYRHDDCFRNLSVLEESDGHWSDWEQGFVTLDNVFYNREEASKIAYEKGQIKKKKTKLYSEDLY